MAACYFVLKPPMQSPDEMNHFCRAYQVSEGQFMPLKKDSRVGGEIPASIKEFMSLYAPQTFIPAYKTDLKKITDGFDIALLPENKVFHDFPNTGFYSPIPYLPQSLFIWGFRQLGCSVGFMYHGTKAGVFILWLLCMVFVIKTTPIGKWLLVAVLLMPMHLYITTSLSADVATNTLSFIFLALCLKYAFQAQKLSYISIGLLALFAILLGLTKVIYLSLLLLLFVIPQQKFNGSWRKLAVIALVLCVSFFTAYLWSAKSISFSIPYETYNTEYRDVATLQQGVNYDLQKQHLLQNKLHIFKVLYNTTVKTAGFYLTSYIGHFGTYMDTPLPSWLVWLSFIVLLVIAFIEPNKYGLLVFQKIILCLAALAVFSMIIVSQHLIWNAVGNDVANSIQGRYLIPVFPLLFLMFSRKWSKIEINAGAVLFFFLLMSHSVASYTLFKRYIQESYVSKVALTCDAENITENGDLRTSLPHVFLKGENLRSEHISRSGRYSLQLNPDSGHSAIYSFKNLQLGDLVEISAWLKGSDAGFLVKGKSPFCDPYEFANGDIHLIDKKGWKKMQMVFSMFLNCDSSQVSFSLFNAGKDTIYVDDLTYSVKKFR
jgi:uncharacterized membrane protein